jgi:single-stranded DNA-binding protein
MPHIITGEIRKAPYTKDGSNNNGMWRMYAVELSERMKIRNKETQQDETVYTNYRATFFAKENVMQWYDEAFQVGKVVSITCDTLNLTSRDHNGTVYMTAEMIRPQLTFSQREPQGQQQGWGQPQQPKTPPQQSRPQNNPPPQGNQYDDDIPF